MKWVSAASAYITDIRARVAHKAESCKSTRFTESFAQTLCELRMSRMATPFWQPDDATRGYAHPRSPVSGLPNRVTDCRSTCHAPMVRAEGLEPSRGYPQRIFVPATAFAAARRRLWSGLSLHHGGRKKRSAVGAARLVSTPSPIGLPDRGLARDRHLTGFPDFEQFCVPGFPARTQVLQVRCVYRSATPAIHTAVGSVPSSPPHAPSPACGGGLRRGSLTSGLSRRTWPAIPSPTLSFIQGEGEDQLTPPRRPRAYPTLHR
jgi:hypothetical protein